MGAGTPSCLLPSRLLCTYSSETHGGFVTVPLLSAKSNRGNAASYPSYPHDTHPTPQELLPSARMCCSATPKGGWSCPVPWAQAAAAHHTRWAESLTRGLGARQLHSKRGAGKPSEPRRLSLCEQCSNEVVKSLEPSCLWLKHAETQETRDRWRATS